MSRVDRTARRKAVVAAVAKRATARDRWVARQKRHKRCIACGQERIAKGSTRFGVKCLKRDAARKRGSRGKRARAWRRGGPGRRPVWWGDRPTGG